MSGERAGQGRAWLEIDLAAVAANLRRILEGVSPASVIPMIKADAYGMGAVEVARVLDPLDPYGFGVASAEEGRRLREAGIDRRIIVFFPCAPIDAETVIEHGLDVAIIDLEACGSFTGRARDDGRTLDLHLEIDTGIGRAGLPASGVSVWGADLAELLSRGGGRIASAFTHFHSADRDPAATAAQLDRFMRAVDELESFGIRIPLRHAANSDAVMHDRQYHLDLVRPGLYLYGGLRGRSPGQGVVPPPDPVATVRARVLSIRELAAGSTVSYGARYVTAGRARVATVGLGYEGGLPWRAAAGVDFLWRGDRVPVRGSICMDVSVADVTGVSGVECGDVLTCLGIDGDDEITLRDLAVAGGTIEYEVLTGFGRRLPRVYRGGEGS